MLDRYVAHLRRVERDRQQRERDRQQQELELQLLAFMAAPEAAAADAPQAPAVDDGTDDWYVQEAAWVHARQEEERAERLRRHLQQVATERSELLQRDCPICMSPLPFGDDGRATIVLSCHHTHAFCSDCIATQWQTSPAAPQCGLCRRPATRQDIELVRGAVGREGRCRAAEQEAQADQARQAAWDALPPAPDRARYYLGGTAPAAVLVMAGEWDAIDRFSALTCAVSPCSHLQDVPDELAVHWARARVDVLEYIAAARAQGDVVAVDRGLRWQLVLHDVLLRGPRRSTRGGGRSAGVIDARFAMWRAGQRAQLVADWERDRARTWQSIAARRDGRGEQRDRDQRAHTMARVLELVEDGELSRAMRMLHSLGICDLTPEVLQQLCSKHPVRLRPVPATLPTAQPAVRVALTEVFRQLRRRGGTGPSGERNEYLRVLTRDFEDAHAARVMPLYDDFASAYASALLPEWFYSIRAIATLHPLVKRAPTREEAAAGAQPDARPIAVGEVESRAVFQSLTTSLRDAFAGILAPQQLAVGVDGGISVVIHGMRLLLELHSDFVIVRIDLRNAYNACDRSALLRRCSEHPELAPLMPLLHAAMRSGTDLLVGQERESLFAPPPGQPPRRRGDSSTGTQQGLPPSSGVFCVAIQRELAALDAELRAAGGCARGIMDDVVAAGPACIVFPAIARFADAVRASLFLEMQPAKTFCYSPSYDLEHCPFRQRVGAQIGSVALPDGSAAHGLLVGGVPIGAAEYVGEVLRQEVDGIVSYIEQTVSQLHADSRHACWASLYYCCASRFDFWLRHVEPDLTRPHARRVDEALVAATEALGYEGMLGDPITLDRARQPARQRGLGLRSRELLASAAWTSCFIESSERFLDSTAHGVVGRGFFPMLQPLFGAGAFEGAYPQAHRFDQFISHQWLTPTARALVAEWARMQAEVDGHRARGPLRVGIGGAGSGRSTEEGLQRQLTSQREQVWRDRLHRRIMQLPHGDTRREAWLACDAFSSAWVSSWPSQRDRLTSAEFSEVLTTYLGRESARVRGLAGMRIPCSRGQRICDAHGIQLGLATLPGTAHADCHDAIADHVFSEALQAGVRGSIRPYGIFSSVLPPQLLARQDRGGQRIGIVPDGDLRVQLREARTARCRDASQRYRGTAAVRGPPMGSAERTLWDCKTVHRGGPCYQSARAREDGQSGAVAERAHGVDADYVRRARLLDARADVRAHNQGSTDAVERRLRSFGTVRAMVWGAYGEASDDVHQLLDYVVDAEATRSWRQLGARSRAEARSYLMCRTRRSWGITAVREMARHRLTRLEWVGARRLPRAAQAVGGAGAAALGTAAEMGAVQAMQRHGRGAGMRR